MPTWTIEYNTVEKSAAAWGLNAAPVLRFRVQTAAEFQFKLAGADPAGTLPFPFEAPVIIRQNRIGGGTSWGDDSSDNHFVFQGRLVSPMGAISGTAQDVTLVFQDAWYDLETLPFQQQWQLYGGTGYFSRAYLFYNDATTPPGYLTVAAQLGKIIDFAISAGVSLQWNTSTIAGPSQMPWYAVRGLSCAGAIKKCLECFPDLVTWIDGGTNPPTFYCQPRASLTPLTLPYKGTDAHGRAHKSSQLKPRYDLVPSQVVLQYQKTIASGNTSAVQLTVDAYPTMSTGMALRALVCPLDLRGSSASFSKTSIVTQAFDPTDIAGFWQTHLAALRDADIVGTPVIAPGASPTVLDSHNNPINLAAYPNEMIRPSKWASWTGVNVIEATVSCYLSYTKARAIGSGAPRPTDQIPSHLHTVKTKLCNAPLGTTNYQTETAYDSGENPVSGLAQNIYASLNQLQFEGHHEIIEQNNVYKIIGPWNVLNLTGGATAWAAMAASIPEVEIDFFRNITRIGLGPARHLAPQDLNNYLQFFRQRMMWDNAQIRSGTVAGAAVDQSGDVPEEDSNSAHPQHGLKEFRAADVITASATNAITLDPANGQILIQQFDSAGATVPAAGIITIAKGELSDTAGKASAHRWFNCCLNDGTVVKAKFLSTAPESV